MDTTSPKINQLIVHFINLDTDQDGYINQKQLQKYMKQMKYIKSPIWMMNDAMKSLNYKMDQNNFITWILGVRAQFQNLALFKFDLQKSISHIQSNAGPQQSILSIKKSFLQFFINKNNESTPNQKQFNHFLKLLAGINKTKNKQKRKQISEILNQNPSQIFLQIKFKVEKNGDQIASQLNTILQVCLQFASQLGPTVQPIIQNLKFTCKHFNGFIFIIIELNHSFFNHILQYVNEVMLVLSPEYKIDLEINILSNFNKILNESFDYLSESMNIKAQFQIDKLSLKRLKQKLIEDYDIKTTDQKLNIMFLFLLQQIKLSSSFSNLKQCFQSLGFGSQILPKPSQYAEKIKQLSVKQLIGSFLPECDQIIDLLQQSCKSDGSISLCLGNIYLQLNFKILIQGFFGFF